MNTGPRSATKAIIISDGKLLCNKCQDQTGVFFMLPGGGQDKGETLHQALQRECLEEISAHVEIGDLLFVRDYIAANHYLGDVPSEFHQVEFMFACTLIDPSEVGVGIAPDGKQIGVEWVSLEALTENRFYPGQLVPFLQENEMQRGVYLGDIN